MNSFMNDLLRSYHSRGECSKDFMRSDGSCFVNEAKLVVHLIDDNARRHSCPAELCKSGNSDDSSKKQNNVLVNSFVAEDERKSYEDCTSSSLKPSPGPRASSPLFGEMSMSSTSTSSVSTSVFSPGSPSFSKYSSYPVSSLSPSKMSLLIPIAQSKTTSVANAVYSPPLKFLASADGFLEDSASTNNNDLNNTGRQDEVLHEADAESSESSSSSGRSNTSLESTEMLLDEAIRVSEFSIVRPTR
ncbi:hypothetical protein IV203_015122 [Nitzschia inconspicua]|uniref:Uncharacterized protein n=1 Tax=Nitzschia inconspicua TaxID=303405 RepID=A0A9K3LBM1_9STRA|nr:hypothetical protein IV203_015122 [Nitzschia inconspicua]